MKTWNKWSFTLKWLGLSAIITIICVVAGGYIMRELTERERKLQLSMGGPHMEHFDVMKNLVASGKFSADEAYKLVEKSREPRGPVRSYLVDNNKNIIDAQKDDVPDFEKEKLNKLSNDRSVVFIREDRGFGQGPGPRMRGGPGGPPPGAHLIGLVSISVSIIVGIGLSFIFLSFYVRKKSKQAEEVIAKLKAGDLKARFKIGEVDETSLLMSRFNEMADQIEILVTNLRNTEKARMLMLQELAHDLRTPVASLKQFQEILLHQGHLLDEESRRRTQVLAMREVNYFERLVEDLLFLSGVNDPRYSVNFKNVSLNDLIQEEVDNFETSKIKVALELNSNASIKGDSHLLKRLLRNALSNASRFARSQITVRLRTENQKLYLEIIDDGPGMKEEYLENFGEKKFSRETSSDSSISIGLGSVIMKKIVTLHEGLFSVSNLPNSGLKLTIQFPTK
ncbi:HAMP domain-containing sensor histidine kinase [Peredibacter starrii]|uniref:histidine kinase n=1 Tax=Peredibacter starrii TaxID=28202 RepID=A0AAX4HRV9_9BACT|nr:HAMP domain-containing sensor histidine kinase [Peredibacter starrii]WPU65918.1 HAMP domain-containing sensor histidine kinase [Peredibacter starrii]